MMALMADLTWIKENETISPNKVDTASSRFTTQKENEFRSSRVIELINQFLPFGHRHRPVKSEAAVSSR